MSKTTANWTAFAAGTVAVLVAAFGAYQLAQYSWAQVVDYKSPYLRARVPETVAPAASETSGTAMAPRVVLVIVDGLREDVSRKMPALNSLRDRGYDAVVRNDQPSQSTPTWTTILSGAPQRISGVTTNWFTAQVPVETLFDVAERAGAVVAVSAPSSFQDLYGVKRFPNVLLRDWEYGSYMTGEMVDGAISLAKESSATLVVVHSPDIDNAGHASGGASKEYLDTALKVDRDISRLVTALQDQRTVFVIVADHGHIDTGGHAGWEREVTDVPAVLAGSPIIISKGRGTQDQIAPTVALLAGLPAPRHATGSPLPAVAHPPRDAGRFAEQQVNALDLYSSAVIGSPVTASSSVAEARARFAVVTDERIARERKERLPAAVSLALLAVAILAVVGVMSWRALVAALSGSVGYYLVYNGLFFLLHGYRWSLSAFNAEEYLKSFFNGRMLEAVIAGVIAVFVAGDVYLVTRADPQRPKGEYLPGWLGLGTATALAVQATLALQVAWYLWRYGAQVTWLLPDLKWAFKYDLDLIQVTALGALAVLGPAAAWIVGRFHPFRTRQAGLESGGAE